MVKLVKPLFVLFFLVMFITLTSAVSIKPVLKDNDAVLYQTCNNCTYCNLTSVRNNVGTLLMYNVSMTANGTYYSTVLSGGNTTTIGTYTYCYDCGNFAESVVGCVDFDVNNTGNEMTLSEAFIRIFLICFFILAFVGMYYFSKKVDFKKWNDGIMKKYENKNYVKFVLSALVYNIMNNVYIIYYLMGLPIIMIVFDISTTYNIVSLTTLMNAILVIYLVGILLVGLVFLSYVQEWIVNTMELIKDMDWGIVSLK